MTIFPHVRTASFKKLNAITKLLTVTIYPTPSPPAESEHQGQFFS